MRGVDPLEGASLLVIMPADYGLPEAFAANLGYLNARHRVIACNRYPFRMSPGQLAARMLRKLVGDAGYRRRLQRRSDMEQMWARIGSATYDFAFCIRPDMLEPEDLDRVRSRSRRCVGYIWDPISRFPESMDRRAYFDRLNVFSQGDASPSEGMPLLGNCYFDCYPDLLPDVPAADADAYFIGSCDERWPAIARVCGELSQLGVRLDINLHARRRRRLPALPPYAKLLVSQKPYEHALAEARRCGLLLDAHACEGLSFRVYEAVGYGKKLITTNPLVLTQDFYRPENIYCAGLDPRPLPMFLRQPMVPLPEEVRRRHGFSAWIRRALGIAAT